MSHCIIGLVYYFFFMFKIGKDGERAVEPTWCAFKGDGGL